ncbi:actin-like ATPase domain-containing protein [Coniophora puteana RWD-64-598 SS2]|uniref:Actin-like ATPase domain-containing protein n=1 Tax=Coniophora puteana (strain RWD-64-598) TaxID=741705 RepID=A0A5M3ME15_CONPW|nr:actin-like ATPase domain-containing protein [Coniophora puteana RWD-64-598 SS2]EIW76821.1 actin-like ATPase domain-containing protein [Coniophora puteana RWD-64-598 SS2]
MRWTLTSFLALLVLSCSLWQSACASVLAIDYGSDWIKASLMKPGVPFDVLLNKDSKRKIQSSVAWKKDDRLFGGDAANIAARFPTDSFSSLKYLQGVPYDSKAPAFFATISQAELHETARGTIGVTRSDGTQWAAEELIAMQLGYVKALAEALAGEPVHDAVLAVPPFYTQFERDAVADALAIAGLRTLALVNDGTAVAVNYAMTRAFAAPEYHVIYDAGASATRATVVRLESTLDPQSKAPVTQIEVKGVGYDRNTGGTELDRRLHEVLVDAFIAKHKRDVRTDKRGMAKLWKEAGRVKTILSANSEAVATVESAAFDLDFKAKVTRAQFEKACADLKGGFVQPIWDALAQADLTLDNITSVILTGGSSRTPMVQAAVRAAVGEDLIAQNVNADEAAVLGAALYGASLSRQFKTKDIRVSDISMHDIQVSYFSSPPSDAAPTPRTISSVLFPAGSKLGSKKTLTFRRGEDFSLWLDYTKVISPGFPRELFEARVEGVAEALGTLAERGAVDPVVKVTVALSESGFVAVKEAVAYGEIKEESLTGKLKSLFGVGTSSTEEEVDSQTPSTTDETAAESSPVATTPPKKEKKVSAKDLEELSTIALNVKTVFSSLPPYTVEEKKASRERLRSIDAQEAAKVMREEALNTLETYLYRLRDNLDDGAQSPFQKCSTAVERKAIAEKLAETREWLNDGGESAETTELWQKRHALEALERPITYRYTEIQEFPATLNSSQKWNWATRVFLTDARANMTADAAAGVPSKWTAEELDGLEEALKEHEVWLNEGVEKQKRTGMNENPAIATAEMKARAGRLEQHLQRLVKRKAPKPPKKAKGKNGKSKESGEEPEGTERRKGHDEL